jgi:hypothetical protein
MLMGRGLSVHLIEAKLNVKTCHMAVAIICKKIIRARNFCAMTSLIMKSEQSMAIISVLREKESYRPERFRLVFSD